MTKFKIYIATPVNGRKEETIEGKRAAAHLRVMELKKSLAVRYPDAEFHSSFDNDIAPLDIMLTKRMYGIGLSPEAVIMGKCVQRVMECDMVVLDYGWNKSKGCRLENATANIYGVGVISAYMLGIPREK